MRKETWFMHVYHDCPNEKSEEMSVSLRLINVGFWRIFISCSGDKWLGNGFQKPLRRFNVRPKVQVDRNSQRSWQNRMGVGLACHFAHHMPHCPHCCMMLYACAQVFMCLRCSQGVAGQVDSWTALFPDWKSFSPMRLIPKKNVTLCTLCTTQFDSI